MRTIPPALQMKLDSGVTTLCRCWTIKRADGVMQGFTDHDEDIAFDAVTCRAGSGLTGSEVTQKLGLAVDSSELSGALADDTLNESDLAAGRYDGATVEIWLVDWNEPALRVLLAKGTLGEVRREDRAFTAEVRGLSEQLSQESGRLYTATCSADLGDGRCRIDLANPAFRGAGAVISPDATSAFTAGGLDGFQDGWFTAGRLTFTSGANSGQSVEVKAHRKAGAVEPCIVAGNARTNRRGRSFCRNGWLRQTFSNLPEPLQQRREFPGIPPYPRQRFRYRASTSG